MRKLILCLFFLSSFIVLSSQRPPQDQLTCNICLDGTSTCNTTFYLNQGNTYVFSTDADAGAVYSWSVSGGLTIIGPRNQQTVQVQVVSCVPSQICLTKSVDGKDPCCICRQVVPVCEPSCPSLNSFFLVNNPNIPNVWCCDAAANFLEFDWVNNNAGTASVTIRDMSFNIVAQYPNAGGADVGWPSGIYISNQNPPPCGAYWLLIVNDCNPQDVLGGYIEVVHCNFGKSVPRKLTENVDIQVYPNPVTENNLTIKISGIPSESTKDHSKIIFRLINSTFTRQAGVWTFDNSSNQFNINTDGISKGIYFLIANIGGKNISKKIIIQ